MDYIKAINDCMSFLCTLSYEKLPHSEVIIESAINRHIEYLTEAGVDKNIIEHFSTLCYNMVSLRW